MISRICAKQRPVEGVQWVPSDALAVREILGWLFDCRANFRSSLDARSTRILQIDTPFGNSVTVLPDMWIVQHPTDNFEALDETQFRDKYDQVVTPPSPEVVKTGTK